MSRLRLPMIFILVLVLAVITSCGGASPTQPPVPAASSTALPPTSTVIPTIAPTLAPSPIPASTATPAGPGLFLPVGIAVVPSAGGRVTYYDLQGKSIGELQTPNLGSGLYQEAHNAGALITSPNITLPPLVFYATQNNGELWMNNAGDISMLKTAPSLFSLVGIPGRPTLAYTLAEYTDAGVRSSIYIGDPQTLPAAELLVDSTNSQSYAIKLLAISTADGQAAGLWYTTVPYGIGGDIVFEPRTALYYLDLATVSTKLVLDLSKSPVGISDDQAWVAYVANSGIGPLSLSRAPESSGNVTIPLREDSTRGAGDAVFSPDDQYVAWREASGSFMDQPSTFRETIRIADVAGNVVAEIPDSSLISVSGFSGIGSAVPVGWLDAQTLAVEVKGVNSGESSVLKVNRDGSSIALLAPGSFLEFLYPVH